MSGLSMGKRSKRAVAGLLVVLLAAATAGCNQPEPVTVTATPTLFPAFSRDILDYVNRCDPSSPTQLTINATAGAAVSINGGPARSGQFTTSISQAVGRRFTLAITTSDDQTTTHSVRCLPPDFPQFEVQRTGTPQTALYATLPFQFPSDGTGSYPTLYDDHGVPVWWGQKTTGFYATVLPNGNPTWFKDGVFEEHRLDGSLVRTYGTVGDPLDFHDLVVLPNGNHVVVTLTDKPNTDLRSWGGPANATIVDHIIQEITPTGQVVWSWRTSDHISVDETTQYWRDQELADPGGPFTSFYDPFHYNSIQPDGDGYVVSFRHDDAIYKINRTTGNIEWKLGGSIRVESLAFKGDPVADAGGAFGGQHDARILSDGTLTLFDNGTSRNRGPRALAYRLDLARRRAILLNQVTDPAITESFCCGSARIIQPRGNYVMGWGGNAADDADITETSPSGQRALSIRFPNYMIYRATPIPFGAIAKEDLRQGMDAQYATQP